MVTRRVAINLVVFMIAAVALVVYGILNLFGNPLANPKTATATFPSAGGLHPNFLVSLDGVPVGSVTHLSLHGANGVKVKVEFDPGTHIPNDVQASIIRSSAVGEQRIDLVPVRGGTGPQLKDHATIPVAAQDPVPPDVGKVLDQVNGLLSQIPTGDLNTVVHEAAVGFAGRAADMRSIVDSLTTLSQAYLQHQDSFRQLVTVSPTLLNGLADSGAQLQQGLERTRVLTTLLKNRRFDLVNLIQNLNTLGVVGNNFVVVNRVNLTCILSDLADTTEFLQGANLTNLARGLELNTQFFGLVDKISPKGFAKDLGLGAPTRNDQTWLRVRTLIPPPQPPASRYATPLPVPATKPGAACQNVYGNGVGPVTQGITYTPLYGAQLLAPTAAQAQAPKASQTGPLSVSAATPAYFGASALPAQPAGDATTWLVLLIGMVSVGLLLIAVPYIRYRWRD